ncbi:hypothetical protein Tco_1204463 [Tanacetum coccineum]
MEAGNPLRLDFNFWQTVNYMAVQEADYCGYFYFLQKRVCCMLLAACTSESILLLIILSAGRLVSAGRTIGSAGSYPFCWSYYDSAGSYPFCCERLLSLSCWTICVSAGRTMVLLDSRVHAGGYRSAVDSFLLIRGLDYSCLVGPCHKSRCGFCLVVSILPGVEMYLLLNSLRIAGKSPFSTLKELLHHVNGGHLLYFMDEKVYPIRLPLLERCYPTGFTVPPSYCRDWFCCWECYSDISIWLTESYRVTPWKGVVRFGKKGKLAPRYVGPFEILERISLVAYRLWLPKELNSVHDTFHMSNLKKCLADDNLHVPLNEIKVDKTLHFVEEPVKIVDLEIRKLKHRKVVLVKVRWNSKRGPEFTWGHEDQMRIKWITYGYPWPELEGKRVGMIQERYGSSAWCSRDRMGIQQDEVKVRKSG